jgi:DNA-directed RNA polymerase beta subunit
MNQELLEAILTEDEEQLREVRHADKFKLYSSRDKKMYIPIKDYTVFTLVENTEVGSSVVQRLPLMRRLLYAYAPRMKRVYNKLLKTDMKEIRKNYGKYINVYFNTKLFEGRSFYYDITPYVAYLHQKLSYMRYVDVGNNFIKSCLSEVAGINNNNILLYVIDSSLLPSRIREKEMYIYMMSRKLLKRDFDLHFDKIFLVSISGETMVRKIYDKEMDNKNKYALFMRYIKNSIKDRVDIVTDVETEVDTIDEPDIQDLETPEDVDQIEDEIEKEIDNAEKENIDIEKVFAVSDYEVKKIADEITKNVLNDLSKYNLSYSVIKSRVAGFIKSDDVAMQVAKAAYDKNDVAAQKDISTAAMTKSDDPKTSLIEPNEEDIKDVHLQEEISEEMGLTEIQSLDDLHSGDVEGDSSGDHLAYTIARRTDYRTKLIEDIKKAVEGPLAEIGYTVKEIKITKARSSDTELNSTILEYINIKCVGPSGKTETLKFLVPKLTEDRFVVSGGLKWYYPTVMSTLPIFTAKEGIVQFRSNYSSIQFHYGTFNRREDIRCFIGGVKIPFALLMSCMMSVEGLLNHFGFTYIISDKKIRNSETIKLQLSDGRYLIINEKTDDMSRCILNGLILMFRKYQPNDITTRKEAMEALKAYTGQNKMEYIFSQIQKYIVDVQTREVLKAHDMPTDLIEICLYCAEKALSGMSEDKLSISQTYLRTTDIITTAVEKGIHTAVSIYKQQHIYDPTKELSVDQTYAIKYFRENGVLQLLEQQNPTEELSAYSAVRIVGPGGLPNKDAVQPKDRALRMDHFGNIDPVDTSEGDPGSRIYLSSGHLYDRNNTSFQKMNLSTNNRYILGPSASLTPYADKDDQGRLILASNQSRQALPLETAEVPMVSSGFESRVPALLSSTFSKKAEYDGTVVYIDDNIMIIENENGEKQVIDIRPEKLKSGSGVDASISYTPQVKPGDKVKKHQLLATNQFIQPVLTQGINAKCCYLSYLGYNYEDGIVVSESFAEKLRSLHYDTIEINLTPNDELVQFPKIKDAFGEGETIVKIRKNVAGGITLSEEYTVVAPSDLDIVDIEVYPVNVKQVKNIINDIANYYEKTNQILKENGMDPIYDKTKIISNAGKYTESGDPLKYNKIIIKMVRRLSASLGDKTTNRHTAKGVITHIVPDNLMPETVETGEKMEVIINSLSVISRMNLGQIHELALGNVLYQASIKLKEMVEKSKSRDEIEEFIITLYNTLDPTPDKSYSAQVAKNLKSKPDDQFDRLVRKLADEKLKFIAAPFNSPSADQVTEAARFLNIKLSEKMKIPEVDSNAVTQKEVAWGIMYMQKLEHISEQKQNVRNVGPYVKTTLEPTRGKSRAGGQRMGELDTWAILAYDATDVLRDFWTVNGDNPQAKKQVLSDIYSTGKSDVDISTLTRSGAGQMYDALLLGMGINPED